MSAKNPSIVRQSVLTTVTCGVAVLIALSMLYALVNFPQESKVFLTSVGLILSAVYDPNAAILHPLLLPGYDLFFWLLGLPMTALFISAPIFIWCYCVAHNLRIKYISNRYTAGVATVRTYLGCFVCFLLYLKVLPLFGDISIVAFMILNVFLFSKPMVERDWYDQFDKKHLIKTQVQSQAPAEVV